MAPAAGSIIDGRGQVVAMQLHEIGMTHTRGGDQLNLVLVYLQPINAGERLAKCRYGVFPREKTYVLTYTPAHEGAALMMNDAVVRIGKACQHQNDVVTLPRCELESLAYRCYLLQGNPLDLVD